MRPAAAALCLVLVTGCAFAKRHPRATTVSITTVVLSAGVGLPLAQDCSNATSTCTTRDNLTGFGIGAAFGLALGIIVAREGLAIPAPAAAESEGEDEAPVARPTRTLEPAPADDTVVFPVLAEELGPPPPVASWTIPWGKSIRNSGWTATGAGDSAIAACAEAKRLAFRELVDECTEQGLPGVASSDLAETDCDCAPDAVRWSCSTAAVLSCARVDTDLIGIGASVSPSRTVAAAEAEELARQHCRLAGLDAGAPTTTCQCDDAGECGCITETACQEAEP